ncbi:MAG: class I SAM-dependent methyltransferase [Thermoplasmata archaeon]
MVPVLWILLAIAIGALAALYFIFGSFLCGAGYQPTFRSAVLRMLELARVGPEDCVYDLGAGTGAILFRAARQHGAKVVGVEIEPIRYLILYLRRLVGGPRARVRLLWQNIFATDVSEATVVALFLWPEAMRRLRPILESKLRPGSRVVSHWHEIPGWVPETYDPNARVYLYHWGGPGSTPTRQETSPPGSPA